MRYMNDYDLHMARSRFGQGSTPNRLALVMVVDNLREATDTVSDGWAYWPKPARAADKAMALIESRTYRENVAQEENDITDEEMLAAVRPIKSFLSRNKAVFSEHQREMILRAVTA